ncbi:Curved DNA-binding protein [Yarrowia sp. B02]|nr:Curved DNA-binding protein [Yarrowia sp. B02]
MAPKTDVNTTLANSEVVYKYRTAGEISAKVLEEVKALCVDGANLFDICVKGDELLAAETEKIFKGKKVNKGIAFPTSISPNNCVAHLSPISTDPEAKITLKTGDVIKVSLGAQIDGYGGVVADTLVVGGGAITGKIADVITAAWNATEVAVRTIKPGNKNWDVTRNVEEVCKAYGCKPAEGMLTHQQNQNVLDGKKQIILNPTEGQKQNFETFTFEADEVYGLDILVSTGDGKVKQGETRTTIYKKTDLTYQLKMRSSRAVFSEVQKKAGAFPFSVRVLEDPTKGRMGLQECKNHGLVIPYDVHYEKDGEIVAEFFTTVGVTKDGNIKLASAPTPDFANIKSDKKIEDEDLLKVLAEPLKLSKKERKAKEAASA